MMSIFPVCLTGVLDFGKEFSPGLTFLGSPFQEACRGLYTVVISESATGIPRWGFPRE